MCSLGVSEDSSKRARSLAGETLEGDGTYRSVEMLTFVLWLLLLVLCWPVALLALVLYPVVWLLVLPFRLVGVAVEGVFVLLRALLFLPARLLGARP